MMTDTSAEAVTIDAATCLLLDGRFVQEADYRKAIARIAELEAALLETQDRANAFATKEYYTEMRAERAEAEVARLRETVKASAKIGYILGFLGEDEARIAAFLEGCGPELIERFRAALQEKHQ